jgi:hypothetical protein
VLDYQAEGEASDWLLHDRGIITFSPELGNQVERRFEQNFFPSVAQTLSLFRDEEQALMYIVHLIRFRPE